CAPNCLYVLEQHQQQLPAGQKQWSRSFFLLSRSQHQTSIKLFNKAFYLGSSYALNSSNYNLYEIIGN
ncbi:hypothetical protein, partial [Synechococcus lacustris]|uniref:hypothetical protein n=1 Tax=Synechococcus lacustris TaxID=2116544 RepID=UPI0020CBB3CD